MDFNDYPLKSVRRWPTKKILLIGSAAIVVLIIGLVIARLIFKKATPATEINQDSSLQARLSKCEDSLNSEICERGEISNTAKSQKNEDFCRTLSSKDYDNCLWGVASETFDVNLCAELSDSVSQKLCQDQINRNLARANKDVSKCLLLSTEQKQQACLNSVAGNSEFGACQTAESAADPNCVYLFKIEEAVKLQDRSKCQDLPDEFKGSCYDAVLVDDPDFDGLSTTRESKYGTDPYNRDTDGDGYTDGEEVSAGYDPNGPGLLK